MASWLDKVKQSARATGSALMKSTGAVPMAGRVGAKRLPPAALIYGLGASILFVTAIFILLAGHWFTATLLFIIAGLLVGLAVVFVRAVN